MTFTATCRITAAREQLRAAASARGVEQRTRPPSARVGAPRARSRVARLAGHRAGGVVASGVGAGREGERGGAQVAERFDRACVLGIAERAGELGARLHE